jgi:hypothetical protein
VSQIENRLADAPQQRAFVVSGHVAGRPVLGAADRPAAGIEHHAEARQVLVHGAETVVYPRPQARSAAEDFAAVHLQHGRAVLRRVGGHRVDECDVVDAAADVREQVADPLAALAVLLELPPRLDDAALVLLAATAGSLHLDGLVVHADHAGLIVERVDLARPAVHEQKDDALRLGSARRRLRSERISEGVGRGVSRGAEQPVVAEPRERDAGEARAHLPEEFAPRAPAEVVAGGRHVRTFHWRLPCTTIVSKLSADDADVRR